ncbi:MAG: 1,4-beta-xylanase, partial [Clostridia bacterium]|nr:1,4-beta-xylanase [Clostridia bacterium]
HDLILREEGFRVRFLRLSDMAVPYGQQPCVSGLRVFGLGHGEKPAVPAFTTWRESDLDMTVSIEAQKNTLGYNILFGNSPEKLYHSYMVFQAGEKRVGALIKGRDYFVRVDAFNESGITEGTCIQL